MGYKLVLDDHDVSKLSFRSKREEIECRGNFPGGSCDFYFHVHSSPAVEISVNGAFDVRFLFWCDMCILHIRKRLNLLFSLSFSPYLECSKVPNQINEMHMT